MVSVSDPRLGAIQEGGLYHGSVHTDLCGFLQVLVVPDATVKSAKSTACLCQSVVHLFVDSCIRGDGAPQVGELLDCLQFSLANCNVGWAVRFLGGGLVENLCLLQADFETEELGCLCEAGCYTLQGSLCVGYEGGIISKE